MKTGWKLAPLLAASALVLGACGGGPASQAPASAAPASQGGASQPVASPAGSGSSPAAAASADISGQTIDVLMPPWADLPQSPLDDFTATTGVKLNYTVGEWEAIRDRVAVAGAANSQLADVTEFDWSWTGQFGKAGWVRALQDQITSQEP